VRRLDIVESGRLTAGLDMGSITCMQVDWVSGEVMRSAGMVEVTVGADDDARTIVLVDETAPCEILVEITDAQSYVSRPLSSIAMDQLIFCQDVFIHLFYFFYFSLH